MCLYTAGLHGRGVNNYKNTSLRKSATAKVEPVSPENINMERFIQREFFLTANLEGRPKVSCLLALCSLFDGKLMILTNPL